jgi:hypothetical protein
MKEAAVVHDEARAGGRAGEASPQVAAAFAACALSLWVECVLRIWFSQGGDAVLRLWAPRAGDIAGMWLAVSVAGLAAYFALAAAWRGRAAVGTLRLWTIVLVLSAIAAPLLGEWGQAIGI